jgi:hypothetical protein
MLPRAGLGRERDRGRQCPRCPGLWWHPARVISSHPRSITPAEPTRLGAPARWACAGAGIADVTQMAAGLVPSCPETGLGQAAAPSGGPHEQLPLYLWLTSEALGSPARA